MALTQKKYALKQQSGYLPEAGLATWFGPAAARHAETHQCIAARHTTLGLTCEASHLVPKSLAKRTIWHELAMRVLGRAGHTWQAPSRKATQNSLVLVITLCLLSPWVSAQDEVAAPMSRPLARVNDESFFELSTVVMLDQARKVDPTTSQSQVLTQMITNRLLAHYARKQYGEAKLYRGQQVGFSQDVAVDDMLVADLHHLFAKEINMALGKSPSSQLESFVVARNPPTSDLLRQIFPFSNKLTLDYSLTPAQVALAKRTTLFQFRMPNLPTESITLYDLYLRQNVQGRMAFHAMNVKFIEQQAQLRLAGLFVLAWSRQRCGAAALTDLRRVRADQSDVNAFMDLMGLGVQGQSDSPLQKDVARRVTPTEIGAFYRRHPEQFRQTVKVSARHIRVASESLAQDIIAAFRQGHDFSQLARTYSIASDASAGGALGWIVHGKDTDWLASLALMQVPGVVTQAFRAPDVPGRDTAWEVVLIENKLESVMAAGSETVRYLASNAIAHDKMVARFTALREYLMRSARITLVAAQAEERS